MKKLLSVLLAVLMVFALVGCGQKEETPAEGEGKEGENEEGAQAEK